MTTEEPRPPTMLAIYNGQAKCGHIIVRGPARIEAFTRDGAPLGIFNTKREAANALRDIGTAS